MSRVARGAAIAAILVCERSPVQSASSRAREKVVVSLVPLLQAFVMCAAIENPASCEVRSVIRFLWAKKLKPIEIYRQLCEVYGNNVISEGGVRQWCIRFKNGRSNVHDEEKSGRPSIVTDELVEKINEK